MNVQALGKRFSVDALSRVGRYCVSTNARINQLVANLTVVKLFYC